MRAGYMCFLTTNHSMMREKTGVSKIGLKSTGDTGLETFGIGNIHALLHCVRIVAVARKRWKILATCFANIGAPSLKNQAGR